jgi:hypothetical protein
MADAVAREVAVSAAFERADQAELAPLPVRSTRLEALRSRLADFWPRAMLAFGGILTVFWAGMLGWLLLAITGLI